MSPALLSADESQAREGRPRDKSNDLLHPGEAVHSSTEPPFIAPHIKLYIGCGNRVECRFCVSRLRDEL